MSKSAPQRPSALDAAILRHIARYRLSVPAAVARLPECRRETPADVSRRLQRLEQAGCVVSTPLFDEVRCYRLTSRGARLVGGAIDGDRPLSGPTTIRRFATLAFCCLTPIVRQRLVASELVQYVSGRPASEAATPYYATFDDAPTRLGFLRIDLGGHGRWDRILAKCLRDARRHADDPVWSPWIAANRFEISLVVALPHKAERLHRALGHDVRAPPVPVRIAVIPDLLHLVAPHPC